MIFKIFLQGSTYSLLKNNHKKKVSKEIRNNYIFRYKNSFQRILKFRQLF